MTKYRVDFKILGTTPNLNRKVFTFATASNETEATHKVIDGQDHEGRTIEILSVTEQKPILS
jgi:hypothetical protein